MATSYTNRLGTSPEEGIKAPCVVETDQNITLSGTQTVNSVAVTAGDRVLVKDQTSASENGIYQVNSGAWTRTTDWNNAEDVISGVLVGCSSNGNIYQGTWSGDYTVDTTEPSFGVIGAADLYNIRSYILDTGAADAYVATLSPAWTAYTTGGGLYFKAANASTDASTLDVNGLGAKDIKKLTDQDIEAGDIEAGGIYEVRYDGTNFQLMNPGSGLTATTAEQNFLDGSIAGTAVASKVLVLGADKDIDTIDIAKDGLEIGGTAVTTTAPEINVLDNVTPGTVTASLALVADNNKDLGTLRYLTATKFDDGTADLEAGTLDNATLSANCILADGVTATTKDLDDNSTKVATTAYVDAQAEATAALNNYILDTGAADAYVATLSPAWTAYTTGSVMRFKAANTSTDASTINVNGLGVKDIKKRNDQDIEAGDIEAGGIYELAYDGTNFQMQTPSSIDEDQIDIESVTSANVITAAENGKTFILNLAGGFESTLPAPASGLHFKFIVGTAPTTAYTIVTDSSANIIHGQICSAEDAAGSVSTTASADTITFVANLAIVGDYVEVISDGTSWFVSGMCNVQDGITTT